MIDEKGQITINIQKVIMAARQS